MGTQKENPKNIIGIEYNMRILVGIFLLLCSYYVLLYSWGSLFGVPIKVHLIDMTEQWASLRIPPFQGLGFRVLGFRFWGLGFRVLGFWV